MIGLQELLQHYQIPCDFKKIKLVRHKSDKTNVDELRRNGWFEAYQGIQDSEIFKGCEYVLAFSAENSFTCRFIGLYKVGNCVPASDQHEPAGYDRAKDWIQPGSVYYSMVRDPLLQELEDRLVIDWGKGALAWHQWFTDRTILEIRAPGRALAPFHDYLRVHLTSDELKSLRTNPAAHQDWITGLSAVGAIYLITNSLTGEQYVGSATGNSGLWQRWCEYADNGHGDNKNLKALCLTDPANYPKMFRYSILDTFSRSLSREEAVKLESFFKQKLGSRTFGLNAN